MVPYWSNASLKLKSFQTVLIKQVSTSPLFSNTQYKKITVERRGVDAVFERKISIPSDRLKLLHCTNVIFVKRTFVRIYYAQFGMCIAVVNVLERAFYLALQRSGVKVHSAGSKRDLRKTSSSYWVRVAIYTYYCAALRAIPASSRTWVYWLYSILFKR